MANIVQAIQESLYFKLQQIDEDEYNWLSDEVIDSCKVRFKKIVGSDCINKCPEIEKNILDSSDDIGHKYIDEFTKDIVKDKYFRFDARVDMITDNIVWEFKCTTKLTSDHLLQLVIYAWMWRMKYKDDPEKCKKVFKLFNVKTGELLRLNVKEEQLNEIMKELISSRYNVNIPKHDEKFIGDCEKYIDLFKN
jgi:hypothetical protein